MIVACAVCCLTVPMTEGLEELVAVAVVLDVAAIIALKFFLLKKWCADQTRASQPSQLPAVTCVAEMSCRSTQLETRHSHDFNDWTF